MSDEVGQVDVGAQTFGRAQPAVRVDRLSGDIPAPPELLLTPDLAIVLGVTEQTVRNYRDAGMPCTVRRSGKGGRRKTYAFDGAVCTEWVKRNRVKTGVGGKRPGSGRKARLKEVAGSEAENSPLIRAAKALAEDPPPDPEMDAALTRLGAGTADGADMRLLSGVRIIGGSGLSMAQAQQMEQLSQTNERNRKAAEARKELVNAAEVQVEWVEGLKRIRVRLSALAGRCSSRVMAAMGGVVPGEKEPLIRAAIAAEVDVVVSEFADNSEAAPPVGT